MALTDETIAILGLGLIGGSLAKALKKTHASIRIQAWDRHQSSLDFAEREGWIDSSSTQLKDVIPAANVVVFAIPPDSFIDVFGQARVHITTDMLLMDVLSVKQPVVDYLNTLSDDVTQQFVPAHPMAGSEKSGITAANADLFIDKTLILTPMPQTTSKMLMRAQVFWQRLAMPVTVMDATDHDSIVAAVSHLPHAIAFAYLHYLQQHHRDDKAVEYAGSGFKDFTRIGHGHSDLWASILKANQQCVNSDIDQFISSLQQLKQRLTAEADTKLLADWIADAQS